MTYTDKTLSCIECKTSFVFSARDQEFHASKGFANEPKRCPSCRQARKQQRGDGAPAGNGAARGAQPVYAGPRAQSTAARSAVGFGRPRGRRNDYDRGGRGGSDGDVVSARTFDGGANGAPASYTATCAACGTETPVPADGANRMVFCPDCYEKMTAIVGS